jgi:hypothetical protein
MPHARSPGSGGNDVFGVNEVAVIEQTTASAASYVQRPLRAKRDAARPVQGGLLVPGMIVYLREAGSRGEIAGLLDGGRGKRRGGMY